MICSIMVTNLSLLLQGGFFIALLTTVCLWDIRKRIIPDTLCLSIALISLFSFKPENLFGLFVGVILLIAALLWGGVGGGDVKFMAANGLVLGFYKGMTALILGFILLLIFHAFIFIIQKMRGMTVPKSYPLAPYLSIGCFVAYLI